MQPMYVMDPETNTAALPYRSNVSKLEKTYRTACCGSIAGILLWIFLVLTAIFVPIGLLAASGKFSHSNELSTTTISAMVSPTATSLSTGLTTTTTSLSTLTSVSTVTVTSVVTSLSVSIVTYSGPSTVILTTAVTTTNTQTSVSTVSPPSVQTSLSTTTVSISPPSVSTTTTVSTVTPPSSPPTVTLVRTQTQGRFITPFISVVTTLYPITEFAPWISPSSDSFSQSGFHVVSLVTLITVTGTL